MHCDGSLIIERACHTNSLSINAQLQATVNCRSILTRQNNITLENMSQTVGAKTTFLLFFSLSFPRKTNPGTGQVGGEAHSSTKRTEFSRAASLQRMRPRRLSERPLKRLKFQLWRLTRRLCKEASPRIRWLLTQTLQVSERLKVPPSKMDWKWKSMPLVADWRYL